ncbi:hypothetical protein [Aliikangiella sp. IMCC44359]|uniref:hypothetical protein n=1 Tax=Aliikangiella sp. IMCC44359 TaxID=3459125 RepID=UPI00403A9DAD
MTNLVKKTDTSQCFDIQIDFDKKYAYLSFFGTVCLKELVDSFSSLIRHPKFEKNMASCFDFTHSIVELTLNQTEIFYHFVNGLRETRGNSYRLAAVCGDEMTKMLVQFYRLYLSRSEVDIQIFEQKVTAKNWLEQCEY